MAHPDEDTAWETADCIGSYYAAIEELRRRWLAGEPMPEGWEPGKPRSSDTGPAA